MSGGSDNADVTDGSPPSLPVTTDTLVVKSPADSFSSTLKTRSSTASGSFQDDTQSEENSFLFLGVAQMLLGVLMAVFGVLAIVHEASLSNVGAGLWGGAVAMGAGVVGVLAGLRNCYSVRDPSPPTLTITSFLALCLVSLAVSNLVVVLAVIGLVRDGKRSDVSAMEDEQVSTDGQNWAPLLANCGLLLMSCAHCLVTIVSGFRCYRQVCPCVGHRDRKQPSARWPLPDSPEPTGSFYSTSSKELLVSNWLGQQRKHDMLLIAQPPIHGPCGPIFTLPSPPPVPPSVIAYHLPNSPFLNPLVPPRYVMPRPATAPGGNVEGACYSQDGDTVQRGRRGTKKRKRNNASKELEKRRSVTEEEVACTYTGLDREIAEEFIRTTMEPGTGKNKQPPHETNADR